METPINLEALYEEYKTPSQEAAYSLTESGLVIVGNELAGSGKDAHIDMIIEVSGGRYVRVPSRKTRAVRTHIGEKDGVDMIHTPIEEAIEEVKKGNYVEWAPLRGKEINGTHMAELKACVASGKTPIKDVEPTGQSNLRSMNPDLKGVYPMPDLNTGLDDYGLSYNTVWEMLYLGREGMAGRTFKDALASVHNTDEQKMELVDRLKVAAKQVGLVESLGLHANENTLFLVNLHGLEELRVNAQIAIRFFETDFSSWDRLSTRGTMWGESVLRYLSKIADIANDALASAA